MTAATTAKAPTGTWALRFRGFREFSRRFLHRRDGVVGLAILIFFTVMAIAPYVIVGPLESTTSWARTSSVATCST